jgi:peptidyl-prolyl cis-trans isomerase A (cyclophilin A)
MRKILLFALLISSMQLSAQTSTNPAKPAAKKPATSTSSQPTAIINTSAGKMTCTLFPDKAPTAVANFVGLAKGTKDWTDPKTGKKMHGVPLYNGTIFHRVIPEFMIQGGDPASSGSGEIGFTIKDELRPDLLYDRPGRLAYANRGPNTSGSQFFITEIPQPALNPCFDEGGCQRPYGMVPKGSGYTIFGQCDDATVELVKKIARMPSNPQTNFPDDPVKINKVTILRAGGTTTHTPSPMPKPKPAPQPTKQQ